MTWLGEQLARIADEMPERDLYILALEARRRRRRNLGAFTAAAMAVVTIIAVTFLVQSLDGEPEAATRPSAPPELSSLKVGTAPTVEAAPLFVAWRKGYFREEGITVELAVTTGAPVTIPQAEAGTLDIIQADYVSVLLANDHGKDFRIVSGLYRSAPGDLAVVVPSGSEIRTMRDLKGKKVMVPILQTFESLALLAALERAGLSERDVVLVERPYPQIGAELRQGRAHAAVLAEPWITVNRMRKVQDLTAGTLAGLHTTGMAADARWVRHHPRTVAAFRRALAKAQRLIADDPRVVREVLPMYTKTLPDEAARMTFGTYPAEIGPKELRKVADLAQAHRWFRGPVDLSTVLRN